MSINLEKDNETDIITIVTSAKDLRQCYESSMPLLCEFYAVATHVLCHGYELILHLLQGFYPTVTRVLRQD